MARQTAKDRQDVVGVPCIRGEDGNLVTSLKERLGVWKNYMDQLSNVENPWNGLAVAEAVEGPYEAVTMAEVEKALRCNKKRKAAGPSGITTEMIQACEEECSEVLRHVRRRSDASFLA